MARATSEYLAAEFKRANDILNRALPLLVTIEPGRTFTTRWSSRTGCDAGLNEAACCARKGSGGRGTIMTCIG